MRKKLARHNLQSIYPNYNDDPDPLLTYVRGLRLNCSKTIFTLLNIDILEYMFGFLTGLDLCSLRRVSTASLSAVDEYMRRVYSVNRIFAPFFTPDQTIELRQIQSETSLLVSGSAVVQFFERVNYPGSNLNLYIEEKDMPTLAQFIDSCGYKFKNSPSQPSSLRDALEKKDDWIRLSYPHKNHWYDDVPQQFMATFSFVKQTPLRPPIEVQIVVSTGLSIAPVFDFHSTVVMNIITYKTAISFFPLSSFHFRETLVTSPDRDKGKAGLQKYSVRGWTVIENMESYPLDKYRPAEYYSRTRSIGDPHSWMIHLAPIDKRACRNEYPLNIDWIVNQGRLGDLAAVTHMQLCAPSGDDDGYLLYHR